ncbi:hypothetical protein WH47_07766, partial [Habropoda laboriosa]
IQMLHIGQCHERGGARVSHEAHNLQPFLVFAALIDIISLLVLVSHRMMYVKFPIMFTMIKFPKRKFIMYNSDPYSCIAGKTTHNSNQYNIGTIVNIKVIDKKSLKVRGQIFFRINIFNSFRFLLHT